MELHQIRYFLKAGETLNFTRVAEQCGVSVPLLSRGIKQLEEELGGQFFRRERRLTHLTNFSRFMFAHFGTTSGSKGCRIPRLHFARKPLFYNASDCIHLHLND
jgi:hypothetical protein